MKTTLAFFGLFAILWTGWPTSANAQPMRDKVTLLNKKAGSRTRLICTVLDHTGDSIRYQVRDGGPTTIDRDSEVISIETSQTRPHIQALEKFAAGETTETIEFFEEALRQESREWVRRDILAMLVKCALRNNNYAQAGERFLMIYSSDETTPHFQGIPLMWTTSPPSPRLKTAALQWMTRANPAAKLLAASALLFDPKYQSSVTVDLQRLKTHPDDRILNLATAQLWRVELRSQKVEELTLEGWQDVIRRMPEQIRGGPHYLLGEGRKLRRQHGRAAASYLWVPFVYPHDYQLSARACLSAAESLDAIGQIAEAVTLYREVIARYPQSPFAQDAAQILQEQNAAKSAPREMP